MDRDEAVLMGCARAGTGACNGGGCTRWRPDGDPTGTVDPPGDLPDQDLEFIYALLPWLRPEEDPPHFPDPIAEMLHPGTSRHESGPMGSAGGPAGESGDDEAVYRLLPWLRPGAAEAAGGPFPPPPLAGAGEAGEWPLLGPDAAASRQFLLFQGFEFAWMCTSHRFTRLAAYVSNGLGFGDTQRGVRFEMGIGCAGDEGRFAMNVRRVTLPPGATYFEPVESIEATNTWYLDSATMSVDQRTGPLVLTMEIPYDQIRAAVPRSVEDVSSLRIDDYLESHRCVFLQGFSIEVQGAKLLLDTLQVGIVSSTWDDRVRLLRLRVNVVLAPGVLPSGGPLFIPFLLHPIAILCDSEQINVNEIARIDYQVRIGIVGYQVGSAPMPFSDAVMWPLDGSAPFPLLDCETAPQRRTRVVSPPVGVPDNAWGDALVALRNIDLQVGARLGTDVTRVAEICSAGTGRLVRRLAVMLLRRARVTQPDGDGYRYSWIGDYSNESVAAYPMEPVLSWRGVACRVAGATVELARFGGRHAIDGQGGHCDDPGWVRFVVGQQDVDRAFAGESFEENRSTDDVRLVVTGQRLDDDEFADGSQEPAATPLLDHRAVACEETVQDMLDCGRDLDVVL